MLAKELNASAAEIMAALQELGEYVKSASSTIEPPVERQVRERFAGRGHRVTQAWPQRRLYPRNNPYMDLGKTEVDHLQAADRRPSGDTVAGRVGPPANLAQLPTRHSVDPLAMPARPNADRGPHKGELDGLTAIMARQIARDNPLRRAPRPPARYWKDEVKRARRLSTLWAEHFMMETMLGINEVQAWVDVLGADSDPTSGLNPARLAATFVRAGVKPDELSSWRWTDAKHKDLAFRVMCGNLTVEQTIAEIESRRAERD